MNTGIAGRSGVLRGVGVGEASGVGTGGVVDFLTRRPDWARTVSTQKQSNAATATMLALRGLD